MSVCGGNVDTGLWAVLLCACTRCCVVSWRAVAHRDVGCMHGAQQREQQWPIPKTTETEQPIRSCIRLDGWKQAGRSYIHWQTATLNTRKSNDTERRCVCSNISIRSETKQSISTERSRSAREVFGKYVFFCMYNSHLCSNDKLISVPVRIPRLEVYIMLFIAFFKGLRVLTNVLYRKKTRERKVSVEHPNRLPSFISFHVTWF